MATSNVPTLLLIPPPGDTTLLADEPGGGRVPQAEDFACNDPAHGLWWTVGDGEPVVDHVTVLGKVRHPHAFVLMVHRDVASRCDESDGRGEWAQYAHREAVLGDVCPENRVWVVVVAGDDAFDLVVRRCGG